jgi:bifunctional ADP-heptose synthase (sugar kinase/adenylyltransferase)
LSVDIVTEFRERKHRYIDTKSGQQLLRVDEKIKTEYVDTSYPQNLSIYDAIVISDYDKGFVNVDGIREFRINYNGPIFVDTKKKNLKQFEGCFVKINQYEYKQAESYPSDLIVTYGSEKIEYKNTVYLPPKVETHDVCGAGDTFLAGLVFKYLEDYSIDTAILFAMQAAAVTVQHIGVYAPKLKEIENAS